MHSSIVLASLFGALAIAAPAHQQLHKKAYVWDIVTEIVTVTVTAGAEPEIRTIAKTVYVKPTIAKVLTTKSKTSSKTTVSTTTTISTTSSTTTTPPPPPPTTTTTTPPPPPPPTTTEPAPVPTTTEAPPVVYAAAIEKTEAAPVQAAPTTAPTYEAPSSSGNGVKDAALNAHNSYRAKHHAGAVSWDDELASSAAALASGCTNQHGMIVGGQNIAAKGVSGSGDEAQFMSGAVDSWYGEVDQFGGYYGSSDVGDYGVLHFTQVVWKATTKIGCAVANCGTSSSFFPGFNAYTIVCNYQSAGNFGGQFAANVAAP